MKPKINFEKLKNLNNYVGQEIDKRIVVYFDAKIKAAKKVDPNYEKLLSDMQQHLLRGGKRLRPTLMLLGYQAAEGDNIDLALDAALSLEIFHSFVLMHDDVMDGDDRRHGAPNITGIYQRRFARQLPPQEARKTAESIAILAGELNEAFTFEIIANLKLPAEVRFELMAHMQSVLFETGAGQQLDVISPTWKNPNKKNIEKVNFYKTAQYTITSPLNFGVIASTKSNSLKNDFAEYGKEVGAAFQMTDDMLGMFGTSRQTGKPVATDLREGKRTMLIYFAKQLAKPLEWQAISSRLGRDDLSNEDVKMVRNILKESGAQAKANVAIRDHLEKAIEIVKKMQVNDEIKELLVAFAGYCVERKK